MPTLNFQETIAGLPPLQELKDLDDNVQKALKGKYDVVVVLDDDPTGTQTVYDVPVITETTYTAVQEEMERGTFLFFILTNSRADNTMIAGTRAYQLAINIRAAALNLEKRFLIILRGDSTLRGHYPREDTSVTLGADLVPVIQYLIPAFFEGGRYTIDDVHYVREGDQLIPAAETPFAQDAVFGYQHSNLRDWIKDKQGVPESGGVIHSLSIRSLRDKSEDHLRTELQPFKSGDTVIVNAADYQDLKIALLAILQNRFEGATFFRTSASFVKALLCLPDQPLINLSATKGRGGLIIVGSHVPKTTAQLAHLREHLSLKEYEVDVRGLLNDTHTDPPQAVARRIVEANERGETFLLYTSREVITSTDAEANLDISAVVSGYLEAVVAALSTAPSYLLTKGGITSSRIATVSLGLKRAMVLGQVQAGVPTWELSPESRFPGMPFIIYPGNVGGVDGLTSIVQNSIS